MFKTYSYDGPVLMFDRCVAPRWISSTSAISEKKAKSNLAYQFKQAHGLAPKAKVTLPGKLIIMENEGR